MKPVTFSFAAEADIQDIWLYTAGNWNFEQADRYTNDILNACHALADGRKQGRKVELQRGYFK